MLRTALATAVLFTPALDAQVRLPRVFGDHMVLQRDVPVRVWGWAPPGSAVTVSFAGQNVGAITAADGTFEARLMPLPASAEGRDLVVASAAVQRIVKDVLVGEVWICGGQSNMEWTLRGSRDADLEIRSANYPALRFLRLPKIARYEPQSDFPVASDQVREGNWRPCTPEFVEGCTGVGYYFGRRLHRLLRVPVGLIDTSWGGTMAQHWVPREQLRGIPELQPYFEQFEARRTAWREGGGAAGARERYARDLADWEEKQRAARAAGQRPPRKPGPRAYENPDHQAQPGGMWNGVIAPIAGFTIRGVLFYQGENNSFGESWKPFPKTYPAVIAAFREAFGDPKLPFGIVQIAGWSNRRTMSYDMNHHCNVVREVQFDVWRRTPGTGLIVTFDTNSNGNIHPGRKLPVGERSARWALAEVYGVQQNGKPIEWRGPVYRSMTVEGDKLRIRFEEPTARGLRLDQDVDVGFYIAGADQVFHHARARVDQGQELLVWSEAVPQPVAVRYGWSNLPAGGLMNGRELPAYPFRTDSWPMVPHQSKGAYQVQRN